MTQSGPFENQISYQLVNVILGCFHSFFCNFLLTPGTFKQTASAPSTGTLLGAGLNFLHLNWQCLIYTLDSCSTSAGCLNSFTRIVLHYSSFRCSRHWYCLRYLWSSYLLHLPLFSDLQFDSLTLSLRWQSWSIAWHCSQVSTHGDQSSLSCRPSSLNGAQTTLW